MSIKKWADMGTFNTECLVEFMKVVSIFLHSAVFSKICIPLGLGSHLDLTWIWSDMSKFSCLSSANWTFLTAQQHRLWTRISILLPSKKKYKNHRQKCLPLQSCLQQSVRYNDRARVDFHILKLFGGLFRSSEGGQSQQSPARKITNMFVFTSNGEDCYAAPSTK